MKPISELVWNRAVETLDDATANLQDERYLVAVNRSYYAVFYALTVLLYEKEHLNTKSHSGAHAKFRELYIKTGEFQKKASTWLDKVWELRQAGDYDFDEHITGEEAEQAVESARLFIKATANYFEK
ncbi:HEPN domain-containing protein [Spirosoma montaniterrae]|uniref:HEPN domain-containing protein n=1 Tax=Spirosoma montaniterrae TaxID=1178516 RepID=A0A1P9WW52_9BACT|nr:HEPN domain-containing protein [Spirosoma montaniterrae]AQG79593.1 hypothetical protein AWR27_09805 [Spirosoma montaniterrae]